MHSRSIKVYILKGYKPKNIFVIVSRSLYRVYKNIQGDPNKNTIQNRSFYDCIYSMKLQSCTKLVGTHALLIIITFIIKMYVYKMTCMIQYPCSKHASSLSLPHQAMLVYTCLSFIPSALSLTTLILGSGEQSFYTKCSISFVQDCIQRLKKLSTKIRKCLIKSKRAVGIAWFLQGTTFRLSILTYTKFNGKPYCLDIKLDLYWCILMNFKQKTIFQAKYACYLDKSEGIRSIKSKLYLNMLNGIILY